MVCLSVLTHAQVSKTLNITTPGTLSTALTADELATVTDLTLTGSIDARDFKTMRDLMPVLAVIDMTGVSIAEYNGTEGTAGTTTIAYIANEIPERAFSFQDLTNGKNTIKEFIYPKNILSIGSHAFSGCLGLSGEINLPLTLLTIKEYAFSYCFGLTGSINIPANITTIGNGVFNQCFGINGAINIPASTTSIGRGAFGSLNLSSINVNTGNPNYTIYDGILYTKDLSNLILCPSQKTGPLNIPSSVKIISELAFENCSKLSGTLTLPNSITEIGWGAFTDCTGLTGGITIPSSVTSIETYAFGRCHNLTGIITIPASVTYIGINAFPGEGGQIIVDSNNPSYSTQDGILYDKAKRKIIRVPQSLKGEITLPSTLTSISENTFLNCSGLTGRLTIPSSVTSIGDNALNGCSGLSEIHIPSSVEFIGKDAFINCTASITIDSNNPYLSFDDGVLYNKDKTILISCPTSKSGQFTVPLSVKTIGSSAFSNCFNISSIKLPQGLTTIRDFAFFYCYSLKTIEIPSTVTIMEYRALASCSSLTSIIANSITPIDLSANTYQNDFEGIKQSTCILYVPIGSKSDYQSAFEWKDFTNIVEMPILNMTLPGKLTTTLTPIQLNTLDSIIINGTIDARDFKTMRDLMPNLSFIDLKGATIKEYTGAEGTAGTTNITYPANAIPEMAFGSPDYGKITLKEIIFPSSLTSIGNQAFSNCKNIEGSLTIPESVKSIGEYAFFYCTGFKGTLTIPNSVTSIGRYAFQGCSGFTGTLNIPSSISSIYEGTFSGCKGISGNLSIPASIVSIENFAFSEGNYTQVSIPSATLTIGEFTFDNYNFSVDANNPNFSSQDGILYNKDKSELLKYPKTKLGDITMLPSVKTIGTSAFSFCAQLKGELIIPSTVTKIESAAFFHCNGLTSIKIPASVTSIGFKAFANCTNLNTLSVGLLTPPDMSAHTSYQLDFEQINNTTCILKVPYGTKPLYQNAFIWKEFENIIEAKDLELINPGTLSQLSSIALSNCDSITIIGTIDARDFKTMRDLMPNLSYVDISNAHIAEYTGNEGTNSTTVLTYPANTIPAYAFYNKDLSIAKTSLKTILLPSNITAIGEKAFSDCTGLAGEFTIPETVTTIGYRAFAFCSGLTQFTALPTTPPDLTSTPEVFAFINKNQCQLKMPSSSITAYQTADQWKAFTNLNITSSVNLSTPGTLATILSNTELSNASSLTISGTMDARDFKTIRDLMPKLSKLNISEATIVAYTGLEGTNNADTSYPAATIPQKAFYDNSTSTGKTSLTTVSLPNNLISIDKLAFYSCSGLNDTILLPSSVVNIGERAFSGCSNVKYFNLPLSITVIEGDAFSGCSSWSGELKIPTSVTEIKYNTFRGCTALTGKLEIPKSVTFIGANAFYSCTGLTELIIPSSVTAITSGAFMYCNNIASITAKPEVAIDLTNSYDVFLGLDKSNCTLNVIEESKASYASADQWKDFVKTIGFKDVLTISTPGTLATLLTPAELSSKTKLILSGTIDARDFKTMRDLMPVLEEVDLSAVTIEEYNGEEGTYSFSSSYTYAANAIPDEAFSDYSSTEYIFKGKVSLKKIIFPSQLKAIGNYAFSGCSGLTGSLTIPNSVTAIGDYAFYNCDGLTGSLTIPNSVTAIGYSAFAFCSGLTGSLTIPNSVTSISSSTFENCSGFTGSLTIPNSVTSIGNYAFYNCSGFIGSLTIPNTATSIGSETFYGCNKISQITSLATTPTDLTNSPNVFASINKETCELLVPFGSLNTYKQANQWKDFKNIKEITVISTPGTLYTVLSPTQLNTLDTIIINGTIDARDFKTMRDLMPNLAVIDLNGATITEYTGSEGPAGSDVKTYSANAIPQNAFYIDGEWYGKESLTSITLPSNTEAIGDYAFTRCNLTGHLNLPSELATIGEYAFDNCYKMTSAALPNSLITIKKNAFSFTKLDTIVIPPMVNSVEKNAFSHCLDLVSINLPSSLTSLSDGLFEGCWSLKEVDIPNGIKSIGNSTFASCFDLTTFKMATSIDSIAGYAFYQCGELDSINISTSVKFIGDQAFGNSSAVIVVDASNLNYSSKDGVLYNKDRSTLIHCPISYSGDFIFPSTVTDIEASAFNKASSINSFTTCEATPIILSTNDYIFYGVNVENAILYVPNGSKALYQAAEVWKDFQNIVETEMVKLNSPGTLGTVLGSERLANDTSLVIFGEMDARDFKAIRDLMPKIKLLDLRDVSIKAYSGTDGTLALSNSYPANEIPISAFYNSTSKISKTELIEIKLPMSITAIGNEAFKGCSGLIDITLNNSITSIGAGAFENCSSFTQISFPDKLNSINDNTFSNCKKMQIANAIPTTITRIGKHAFENCESVTSITLPQLLTSIDEYAFSGCSNVAQELLLSDSIKTIGAHSFENCSSLTGVKLPQKLETIAPYTFAGCKSISTAVLPDSLKYINENAFENCSTLSLIDLSTKVKSIGNEAFKNCSSLNQRLTFKNPETTIGDGSFYGCSKLFVVDLPKYLKTLPKNVFKNCTSLQYINLTDSIITIENNAFENCSGLSANFILPKNLITFNDSAFANSSLRGTLTIPSKVTTIGKGTFAGCRNLTMLSIPGSVSYIGSNAFSDCSGLKEIYAYAETPIDISNSPDVFKNVVKTSCTLHVPMGAKPAYRIANQWKEFRKLVDPASSLDDDEGDDHSATLMIYPNPVSTTFRISGFNGLATVSVIDLGGNTLLTKLVSEKESISLDELPQATYIVRIITNEGHAEKLLTKR